MMPSEGEATMRWLDDLRFAARGLFRRPLLAFGGAATLGLGIGATTAVYSAVDALLVRSLPFPEADRLVQIESARGGQPGSVSYREVRDLRELSDLFVDVASYTDQGQYNASGDGRPEELPATITTQNLFRVLGVPLAFGAAWPEVLDHTRDFKLIISHELWQRRFGGGSTSARTIDPSKTWRRNGSAPAKRSRQGAKSNDPLASSAVCPWRQAVWTCAVTARSNSVI